MYPDVTAEQRDNDPCKLPLQREEDMAFYDSKTLFGKRRQIAIMHNGTLYRLRITRFGKLIMNK